jgi:hypothetical protein
MKKLAAILTTALLAAAGCSDTCSTKSAPLDAAASPSCAASAAAISPGATATAPLCQRCTDSSPSCQVEVVGTTIEINSTLKECDSDKGCGDPSCANPRPAVSCTLPANLAPGNYTIQFIGASGMVQYPATVASGGSTTCTL